MSNNLEKDKAKAQELHSFHKRVIQLLIDIFKDLMKSKWQAIS